MDLNRYIDEMKGIAEDIFDELDDGQWDLSILESDLRAAGIEEWRRFKQSKISLIHDFIASTPSQRQKLKKFQDFYPLIALGAYQECIGSIRMLESIYQKDLMLGLPYRKFAGLACKTFNEVINYSSDNEWPWGISLFNIEDYT
ncbi:hypothetical protein [Aliivibrio sifiae]|uniref:hypothetical protein n=1 Tax=Aliivibrio sifiae TaxID=566293 RepID=UPI003D13EF65